MPQESTSFSPFELLYGRTIRGSMSILQEIWAGSETNELRNKLERTCKLARDNLAHAQARYKKYFDRKAKVRSLEVGSKFLLMLPTTN